MWWIIQMPLQEPTTMFYVIKKYRKRTLSTDMENKDQVPILSNLSAINCIFKISLLRNVY